MYQPLPAITEDLDSLQARLRSTRDPAPAATLAFVGPAQVRGGHHAAPAGARTTFPPAVFEQLKTHLATPTSFASYLDVQRWLREEFGVEVPYKTLHGIVR